MTPQHPAAPDPICDDTVCPRAGQPCPYPNAGCPANDPDAHPDAPETEGTCPECGHQWSPDGCTGEPTPSDLWAGVSPSVCDCPCPVPAAPETETDANGLTELLRLATPAPWSVAGVDGQGFAVHRGEHETVALYCDRDNARLIAAAVNALPALLADLDAARERVRVLEGERDAARATHRDLVSRLGFGDNITEPMADNDTIVKWFDQQSRDASEWQESQLWRNDCYAAGHPQDEDCHTCDPRLALTVRAESAEAAHEAEKAAHERLRAVAESIAYEHAATVDGEFGCCHNEDELRAGGRGPSFDGDEFEPIADDCPGQKTLDRHLALLGGGEAR